MMKIQSLGWVKQSATPQIFFGLISPRIASYGAIILTNDLGLLYSSFVTLFSRLYLQCLSSKESTKL